MFDKEILKKTNNSIKIHHGDSLELLKNLPDDSVDMIITSPPYCMGKEYENLSDDEESFIKKHKIILPEDNGNIDFNIFLEKMFETDSKIESDNNEQ